MSSPQPWKQCDPHVFAIEDGLLAQPNVEKLQGNLLPYGIFQIDVATKTGIDIRNGELIAIQGPEKNRKTTLALNLVWCWCKWERHRAVLDGGAVMVETLESSMTRQKYKQSLVVMEATDFILQESYGWDKNGVMKLPLLGDPKDKIADMRQIREDIGQELRLSVGYATAALRTSLQQKAIEYAVEEVNKWPLLIYGAAASEGATRAIKINGNVVDFRNELPYERWKFAIEQLGARLIVIDHIQGYAGPGGLAYQMLDEIVDRVATIVAEEKVVVVAVSQISLGSMREPALGYYARGGKRLAEEANIVFGTRYTGREDRMIIDTAASRGEPPPTIMQPMDMYSGKFIGRAFPYREYPPG